MIQHQRHTILVITDRLDGAPTNGAQVMARALIAGLSMSFDLRLVVMQDREQLPDLLTGQIAVIYNFGCTAFSSELTATLHARDPTIPVINHFQLILPEYARQEGYRDPESTALGEHCRIVAECAACNIFPSFSELNCVLRLGWSITHADNRVIPNAFVPAARADPHAAGEPPIAFIPKSPGSPKLNFLAAGRFSDYVKGADLLYRAFSEYYETNPAAHLYIAADEQRFIRMLRPLPEHAWTFLGWLDRRDLYAWLSAADVFIMPSRYEPFGLLAIEAMAMATPVIAMASGGPAEIIHHGHTGWLCDPREGSLGLKRAMEEAETQKDRLPQMGAYARAAVETSYSLPGMTARVKQLFDNLLFHHELVSC